MNIFGPNYWDGIASGASGYDNFHELLSILDFPMESLEGDGPVEDWDASNYQCLGAIPSDALLGLHPVSQPSAGNDTSCAVIKSEASPPSNPKVDSIAQQNEQLNHGEEIPIPAVPETMSIKSDFIVPVRRRSKRTRSPNVNPWLLMSPIHCTTFPLKNTPSPKKKKKRELSPNSISMKDVIRTPQANGPVKRCSHCEVTETPQWREGPLGRKTLCNACGVRYRSGRLFPEYRPAVSPAFVPSLHSNSRSPKKKKKRELSPNSISMKDVIRTPQTNGPVKRCSHCEVTETPQWREGPLGRKTLCNACGVRYRSGRLFPEYRPAVSPSFVPSLHSNSRSPKKKKKRELSLNSISMKDVIRTPQTNGPVKRCSHCEVTETPQWREGPLGRNTLCNACGVRYRSGRLFPEYRPAVSPAFVPSLHSNSHKQVMQMRRKTLEEVQHGE